MPIHDFRCTECNHVHEALVHWKDKERECPECGNVARRVFLKLPELSYLTMGAQKHVSPEFQSRFDKMHRDQKAKEEKSLKEHGDYGPSHGYQEPGKPPAD
jgi:putative FmdB family regulatory protein